MEQGAKKHTTPQEQTHTPNKSPRLTFHVHISLDIEGQDDRVTTATSDSSFKNENQYFTVVLGGARHCLPLI